MICWSVSDLSWVDEGVWLFWTDWLVQFCMEQLWILLCLRMTDDVVKSVWWWVSIDAPVSVWYVLLVDADMTPVERLMSWVLMTLCWMMSWFEFVFLIILDLIDLWKVTIFVQCCWFLYLMMNWWWTSCCDIDEFLMMMNVLLMTDEWLFCDGVYFDFFDFLWSDVACCLVFLLCECDGKCLTCSLNVDFRWWWCLFVFMLIERHESSSWWWWIWMNWCL